MQKRIQFCILRIGKKFQITFSITLNQVTLLKLNIKYINKLIRDFLGIVFKIDSHKFKGYSLDQINLFSCFKMDFEAENFSHKDLSQ